MFDISNPQSLVGLKYKWLDDPPEKVRTVKKYENYGEVYMKSGSLTISIFGEHDISFSYRDFLKILKNNEIVILNQEDEEIL
jgi:hypothetical protein